MSRRLPQPAASVQHPILGGLKDCTVSNVQETGSTATGTVTLSFIMFPKLVFSFKLINASDGWKIDSTRLKLWNCWNDQD